MVFWKTSHLAILLRLVRVVGIVYILRMGGLFAFWDW